MGKTSLRVSEQAWYSELKGIYGYRSGRSTLAVNPNFGWSLSGPGNAPVSSDVDTKIAYKTDAGHQVGLKSCNELGTLRNLGHLNQLSQTLYGVIDTKRGKFDLNAGTKRGLVPASDR